MEILLLGFSSHYSSGHLLISVYATFLFLSENYNEAMEINIVNLPASFVALSTLLRTSTQNFFADNIFQLVDTPILISKKSEVSIVSFNQQNIWIWSEPSV